MIRISKSGLARKLKITLPFATILLERCCGIPVWGHNKCGVGRQFLYEITLERLNDMIAFAQSQSLNTCRNIDKQKWFIVKIGLLNLRMEYFKVENDKLDKMD